METIILNGKEYQLDIEQAKKLNLLKERDSRVKSWEEYIKKYNNTHAYSYNSTAGIIISTPNSRFTTEQLTPHEAKALSAFSKLLKLRRDWIGEWKPDWSNTNMGHGIIWVNKNEVKANVSYTIAFPLSFPNHKMAKEFLETFRDLIEDAKVLI